VGRTLLSDAFDFAVAFDFDPVWQEMVIDATNTSRSGDQFKAFTYESVTYPLTESPFDLPPAVKA
jgi:hypothetical protein